MRQATRKRLAVIRSELESYRLKVEDLGAELREMAEREQESYDNLPEGLQQADRGQEMSENASALDDAANAAEIGNAGDAWEAIEKIENLEA